MEEKIKVLLITADPENNISFYRGRQPMLRLSERYPLEFTIPERSFNVSEVEKYDVVYISCPYTTAHADLIKYCVEANVKVWVDIDDLLTEVSVWNERPWLEYINHPVAKVLEYSISNATWVTVSTNFLKQQYEHLSENIWVIENAFDDKFLDKPSPIASGNTVLYRGGESHKIDLWEYHKPIINAIKGSGWNPHFVGMNPIFINMELNGTWTPQLSKPDYWRFLESQANAKVVIVPLKNMPFNHAKSCIAWIEATYAGSAVLAPDWVEWKKPGILNYTNGVDFEGKLKGMISGRIDLKKMVNRSREYIMNCQTLEKVNEARWAAIVKYCKPQ